MGGVGLPAPIPNPTNPRQPTSRLDWTGPGVAVLFEATSFEEDKDGTELVLRDSQGGEVARLSTEHVLRWIASGG